MGMLESLPYMIGGPLILSLAIATYVHTKKEPAGIFLSLLLFVWGMVFSLFPFMFFAGSYDRALLIFRIMASLLVFVPFFYAMAIMTIVKEEGRSMKRLFIVFLLISFALILSIFLFPELIGVRVEDGIYHGTFSLQSANLTLVTSIFFLILPSFYALRRMGKVEPELQVRARGTIAAYVASDIFYVTEVYLAAFKNYDYIHFLNALIVMCAYAIYYFFVMRRVYRGSLS